MSQTLPKAQPRPHSKTVHGETLADPYNWLRDPGYPEVKDTEILAYLEAENSYFDAYMAPHKDLVDTIFAEIKGRIKEDDESVPWQAGPYEYRWAFAKGAQYRTWYYRPRSDDMHSGGGWSVLYDEAAEAQGLDYFRMRNLAVSDDGRYLAFAIDTNGSERYTVHVRDLETGEERDLKISETSGEMVWDPMSGGLYTVSVSAEWRPYKVQYHALGGGDPTTVYEEASGQFFVHIGSSGPKTVLVITSSGHTTSEVHWIPRGTPNAKTQCLQKRRDNHDYKAAECLPSEGDDGPSFIVSSNRDTVNFDLFATGSKNGGDAGWTKIRSGSPQRYIRGFTVMQTHLLVEESNMGQQDIVVLSSGGEELYSVEFAEDVRSVGLASTGDHSADFVRISYESLTTPASVFDLDMATGALTLRKEQEIPSGYDKKAYASERLMVTARDGAQVPISIVYRKDWQLGSDAPLHLYGYGAYGIGMDPAFSVSRLSLLDRGFAYAIAHIRGGDDMGYQWYLDGKLTKRTNTFHDFVDVSRALIDQGYAKKGRITISGGSAGGELMGAAVNEAGELYAGAVLHVPFVDVLNTMLDETLPLTPMEWPEWGNPIEDIEAFQFIQSYCPYTNIEAKGYPAMMVTGGLNDPRVTYWEPAKWTAKLRAMKTDENTLIMKMNMGAGHGGKSGRFERIWETAEEYVFCLQQV